MKSPTVEPVTEAIASQEQSVPHTAAADGSPKQKESDDLNIPFYNLIESSGPSGRTEETAEEVTVSAQLLAKLKIIKLGIIFIFEYGSMIQSDNSL